MALILDATPGGAAANTYVLLTDAETYFLSRPFSAAWTASTDPVKSQALAYATILLDRQRWLGTKGTTSSGALTQALAWPRRWAPTLEFDSYPQFVTDNFIDTSTAFFSSLTIPTPIVRATCELALEILNAGTTDPLTKDPTRNIKREKIDVLETEYFDPQYRVYGLGLFPAVMALIAPLLRSMAREVDRA